MTDLSKAAWKQGQGACHSLALYDRRDAALGKTLASVSPIFPLDPSTNLGTMEDERHTRRVREFVERAGTDGADVAVGGTRTRPVTGGCYIEPTIFDTARNDMRIAQEQIFDPMLTVIPADSVDEATQAANDSYSGLESAV